MNGSKALVQELAQAVGKVLQTVKLAEIVIFPPYVYLSDLATLLQNSPVLWGAQNVCQYLEGAYTGEVSAQMLAELKCSYVIVGHSERRTIFHETNHQVAQKFFAVLQQGLKPILCVGESLNDRETGRTFDIITEQLDAIFSQKETLMSASGAVIAYEPIWAIGTGKTATPEQAQEVHAFIRKFVEKYDKTLALQLRILYGGSLKSSNAQQLFAMPDIDGGLIGGASLQAKEFLEIINLCNNSY